MFDAETDPRRQFVALAAIALFDALIAYLEERDILGPEEQGLIVDDAVRFCREGSESMQIAAEFICEAFDRTESSGAPCEAEPLRGRWLD